ncbi:hypothetical protein ABIE49_003319 [Bradyrhizobium sp. OAE829]
MGGVIYPLSSPQALQSLRGSYCLQKASNASALTDGPRRMGPGSRPGRRRCLLLHHHPKRSSTFSRRIAPEVCWKLPALFKQRAQGRPGARCTRGPVCGLHKTKCTRAYRAAENTRPSLRNGFTAYAVISPETSSWLTPSLPFPLALLRQLDTCNGCQDHTVLPYAYPRRRLSVNQRPPQPVQRP